MTRRSVIVVAVLVVALTAISGSAAEAASGQRTLERTGDQLPLLCFHEPLTAPYTCQTRYFTPGQPFHIWHKYICNVTPLYPGAEPEPDACKSVSFRLWLDGKRTQDFVYYEYWDSPTGGQILASKGNVTNYANGLSAGTYQFHWEFWRNSNLEAQGTTPVVFTT
jgi:hypothetical protein